MGMSSYNCLRCGHPMLMPYNTNEINSWMSDVVAIYPNGARVFGEYDGYARIGDVELGYPCEASCYHLLCWKAEGEPGFTVPSPHAEDQGHFFDEGAHDLPKPEDPRAAHLWTGERGPKPEVKA